MIASRALLLAAVLALVGCEQSPESICMDADIAYEKVQHKVADRLKSPSSAVFSEVDTVSIVSLCSHWFDGYVDSQNSFGAMVRVRYSATAKYDIATMQWKVIVWRLEQ